MTAMELYIDEPSVRELIEHGRTREISANTPFGPMRVQVHLGSRAFDEDDEYFWIWSAGITAVAVTQEAS